MPTRVRCKICGRPTVANGVDGNGNRINICLTGKDVVGVHPDGYKRLLARDVPCSYAPSSGTFLEFKHRCGHYRMWWVPQFEPARTEVLTTISECECEHCFAANNASK